MMDDDAIVLAERRREKARERLRAMRRGRLQDIAFEAGAQADGDWWPELAPLTHKERASVRDELAKAPIRNPAVEGRAP